MSGCDAELRRRDLRDDPLAQFAAWFADACSAGIEQPEAMALATVAPDGSPSLRMVLLKRWEEGAFVFHTNLESRKAGELDANPAAALLLHWHELGRQVRIEGRAERLSRAVSEAYFRTRPRGAQLGAWASRQSRPLTSRDELERAVEEAEGRFAGAEVPLPDLWGGFAVVPHAYEFWQHRDSRLHDRFRYTRSGEAWRIERLAP